MIIKSKIKSTNNTFIKVYEPIDKYVTSDIIFSYNEILLDKFFEKRLADKKTNGILKIKYDKNYLVLLLSIKKLLESTEETPNIIIYVDKNEYPHDLFLKYFTVIKY